MSSSAPSATLVKALGVDRQTLRQLNPALRAAVWNGQRPVPAGYVVRLPGSSTQWTADLLAQRLGAAKPVVVAAVTPPASVPTPATVASHAARDTGSRGAARACQRRVARRRGCQRQCRGQRGSRCGAGPGPGHQCGGRSRRLAVLPGAERRYRADHCGAHRRDGQQAHGAQLDTRCGYIYGGQRLRLVAAAPEPETVTTAATLDSAKAAVQESEEEEQAVAAADKSSSNAEPV